MSLSVLSNTRFVSLKKVVGMIALVFNIYMVFGQTLTISANPPGAVCAGTSVTFNSNLTGGTASSYEWKLNGGNVGSNSAIFNSSSLANNDVVQLVVTLIDLVTTINSNSITLLVNAIPSAPNPSNDGPKCTGSALGLTATTVTGATYAWTGPNGFSSNVQNPSIAGATTANTGVYSVIATVGTCASLPRTTAVSVTDLPTVTFGGTLTTQCVNSTTYILSGGSPSGGTYSGAGVTGTNFNASAAGAGTHIITYTYTDGNGCTNSATNSITVNALPATPTAGNNGPVCAGSTLNLTASLVPGATYAWTGPNGFTSTLQNPSITNATAAVTGTYSVTATLGGCTSAAGTTTVAINAVPAAPVANSNGPTICIGNTINLTASMVVGATYSWTGPNGFTSTLQNPTIPSATLAATGIYNVTVTLGGCVSPAASVNVSVVPLPTVTFGGVLSSQCANSSTYALTGGSPAGGTYSGPGVTGSNFNALAAGIGTHTITYTYTDAFGCSSSASNTITVSALPTTPIAGNDGPKCAGTTLNLTATTILGATYSWTGPNGFTSASQNPSIAGVTTAATGTYSVTATVGNCVSAVASTNATVNALPATPIATATNGGSICLGSTLNLFSSAIPGATFSWTGPNTFVSSLQNPSIINAQIAATGVYSVIASVGGCASLPGSVAASVNPFPIVTFGGSLAAQCANSTTYTLTGGSPSGGIYSGPGVSGSNFNASTVGAGTFTITYAYTDGNGCTGNATNSITVNPMPANAGTITGPVGAVCQGLPGYTFSVGDIANVTSYSWLYSGSGATINGTGKVVTIDFAANATAGNLTVNGTNGCGNGAASTLPITVNQLPAAVGDISGPKTVCQGANNQPYSVTPIANATSYTWTYSGTGASFSGTTSSMTINFSATATSGNLSVKGNNACGVGIASADYLITVNSLPASAGPITGSNTACQGQSAVAYSIPLIGNATGYVWTLPSGAGFASGQGSNSILVNFAAGASDGDISVYATNACGSGATSTQHVIVTPMPTANAGGDAPICSTGTFTIAGSSAPNASSVLWTRIGDGTFDVATNLHPTYTPGANDIANKTATLILTATGNAPCSTPATDQMVLTINSPPTADAGVDALICQGSTYTVNSAKGTNQSSFSWVHNGTGSLSNTGGLTPTYTPGIGETGTVTLTLTVHAINPCSPDATAQMHIQITPQPAANAGPALTTCGLTPFAVPAGNASTTNSSSFLWTHNGFGSLSAANSLTPTYTPNAGDFASGLVLLTLTANGNAPCTAAQSQVLLTVNQNPTVSLGPDLTICEGPHMVQLRIIMQR